MPLLLRKIAVLDPTKHKARAGRKMAGVRCCKLIYARDLSALFLERAWDRKPGPIWVMPACR